MPELNHSFNTLRPIAGLSGEFGFYHSLSVLELVGFSAIAKLRLCVRIVWESVLRNCGQMRRVEENGTRLAGRNTAQPVFDEVSLVFSPEFVGGDSTEAFSTSNLGERLQPVSKVALETKKEDDTVKIAQLKMRIDTAIEKEGYKNGSILPYVLRQILKTPNK